MIESLSIQKYIHIIYINTLILSLVITTVSITDFAFKNTESYVDKNSL